MPEPSVPGGITFNEKFWVQHYEFLKDMGYSLRPRYQPGWTPPWKDEASYYRMHFKSEQSHVIQVRLHYHT